MKNISEISKEAHTQEYLSNTGRLLSAESVSKFAVHTFYPIVWLGGRNVLFGLLSESILTEIDTVGSNVPYEVMKLCTGSLGQCRTAMVGTWRH